MNFLKLFFTSISYKAILLTLLFSLPISAQTWENVTPSLFTSDSVGIQSEITFATKDIGWLWTLFQKESPNGDFYKMLYKTTDGGKSWKTIMSARIRKIPVCKLYSPGADELICLEQAGNMDSTLYVYRTSDGGISWDSTAFTDNMLYNSEINNAYFFNKDKWICFERYAWFTSDGGHTWIRETNNRGLGAVADIDFVNERLGWIASWSSDYGTDIGSILNTTDGGKSWKYQDSSSYILFGVDFLDSLKGFCVGTNITFGVGYLCSTTDGGKTWTYKRLTEAKTIRKIRFIDDRNGWIICGARPANNTGSIFRTSDGGQSWEKQISGVSSSFERLMLLKEDKTAYVLGYDDDHIHLSLYRADLSAIVGVKEDIPTSPKSFSLSQNYPNPFNPSTRITFQISTPERVSLKIYDMLGREVGTLVNEFKSAGRYSAEFNGSNLPSGIYIYELRTDSFAANKKLILVK